MKYLKSIFITLSILLSITNSSFALDVCPGENKTLSWSSSNATNCIPNSSGIGQNACNFSPTPNVASSQAVTVPAGASGNFCTVTLTCTNAANVSVSSSDSLYVKTLGQCGMCPAGQVPDNTSTWSMYAGNGCITPTATIIGGSCTIPVGQSSCNVPVTFSTTYVNNPGLFNYSDFKGRYYNGAIYGSGQSFITGSRTEANVTVGGGTPVMLGVREMSDTRNTFVVSGGIKGENCDVAFGESTRTTPISWTSAGGTGAEVLQVQASC